MFKGYIRPIQLEDAEIVLSWRNRDSVRLNMYNHQVIDSASHETWFRRMLSDSSCEYFIYEQQGVPLGVLAFVDIDHTNRNASWAFYSGDTAIRGIGSEMEQIALEYAFNKLKLNKLSCEVLDFNSSVISFHRKFGFKLEGVKKQEYCRDGQFYDIYQLAIFSKDYFKITEFSGDFLEKNYLWEFKITNEDIDIFAKVSGDHNPVHLDKVAAKKMGFNDRIAHGAMLVSEISKVAAMSYPGLGTIYLTQTLDFKSPVYPDMELQGKAKLKTQIGRFAVIEFSIYCGDSLVAQGESEFLLSK